MLDVLEELVSYEQGQLDEEETREFFQALVDTGLAWSFQGHYGRMAARMLKEGEIVATTPVARRVRDV